MTLLYLLAIVVLINCFYFLLFSKFSFANSTITKKETAFPVSLIVCAKNEAENLKKTFLFG